MEVKAVQIDHIDENTIRVQISKEELAERGVKMLDMLSDRSKIQHFFYSILSEVDTDHTFAHDEPVTFQVMPNSGGLDLLISKVKDGNLNQIANGLMGAGNPNSQSNSTNTSDQQGFFDLERDNAKETQVKKVNNGFINNDPKENNKQAYSFSDLGEIIELADNLQVADLASSLYYKDGHYFLELAFLDENYVELKPNDAWAIANEYGYKLSDKEINTIKETGTCLLKQDALGNIRHYFFENTQF